MPVQRRHVVRLSERAKSVDVMAVVVLVVLVVAAVAGARARACGDADLGMRVGAVGVLVGR